MAKKPGKRNRKGKKHRTEMVVTPISKHKKVGKDVIPPLAQLKQYPGMMPADWAGDRLPEMLWGAMLIAAFGRDEALERFRHLGRFIQDRCHKDESRRTILRKVTLTGLAAWDDDEWAQFVEHAVRDDATTFAALTVFDDLPGVERWRTIVPTQESIPFDIIKTGVGIALFHQSQEATDLRWMRALAMILSGSLRLPTKEFLEEVLGYPNHGDQRKVRPFIRTLEGAADVTADGPVHADWPKKFWAAAFQLTKGDHLRFSPEPKAISPGTTVNKIESVRESLRFHAEATTQGTAVDPKHEAAFGLTAYALDVLAELMRLSNCTSILGRMGLRSITELVINFTDLATRDDADLWQKFRDYGYGQAKLAYLKLLETETLPDYITVEYLETLSNEDVWHEFREIHIGHWADMDLRKLSESNGLKNDVYDKYYDWSSAFIHGNWAAVRDTEYDLCLNPLHRLHRVISLTKKNLPDVVADAVELVNRALVLLNGLYPGLNVKL